MRKLLLIREYAVHINQGLSTSFPTILFGSHTEVTIAWKDFVGNASAPDFSAALQSLPMKHFRELETKIVLTRLSHDHRVYTHDDEACLRLYAIWEPFADFRIDFVRDMYGLFNSGGNPIDSKWQRTYLISGIERFWFALATLQPNYDTPLFFSALEIDAEPVDQLFQCLARLLVYWLPEILAFSPYLYRAYPYGDISKCDQYIDPLHPTDTQLWHFLFYLCLFVRPSLGTYRLVNEFRSRHKGDVVSTLTAENLILPTANRFVLVECPPASK